MSETLYNKDDELRDYIAQAFYLKEPHSSKIKYGELSPESQQEIDQFMQRISLYGDQRELNGRIDAAKAIAKRTHQQLMTKDNSDIPTNYVPGAVENIVDDYIATLTTKKEKE